MIASYSLVDSTYQFLDAGANLLDTFYLPDSYLFIPAIGASSGTLISEDNGKHTRFISNTELLAMGFATVALFTTQFNTDKGTVQAANTNIGSNNLTVDGNRSLNVDGGFYAQIIDPSTGMGIRVDDAGDVQVGNINDNVIGRLVFPNAGGINLSAVDGDIIKIGDAYGEETGWHALYDELNESLSLTGGTAHYAFAPSQMLVGETSTNINFGINIGGTNPFFGLCPADTGWDGSISDNAGQLMTRTSMIDDSTLGTGATTDIVFALSAGYLLRGVALSVTTAITTSGGNNTFDIAFSGGSTTSIETGVLGALNTKSTNLIVPEITTASTNITLTAGNAENFASGAVRVIIYFDQLKTL